MSGSVEDLFSSLLCKGFAYGLDTNPYWKESLPGRYHYFSGNYHKFPEMEPYKFESIVGTVGLQMAPPQTHKSVSYLEFDVDLQLRLLTIECCYSPPVSTRKDMQNIWLAMHFLFLLSTFY
jgi:hypothetical protein